MHILDRVKISILITESVHTTLQGGQSTTESFNIESSYVLTRVLSLTKKRPQSFREWFYRKQNDKEFVDNLYKESRKVVKITPDFIKEQIQILETVIKKKILIND